jgi:hypothetical protein
MVEDVIYLDQPTPKGQRISALHVWIAVYADGSEGIVSTDIPMPDGQGMRHMPLMSSDLDLAKSLEVRARRLQVAAIHQADRIVRMRLVTYRRSAEEER